MNKALVTIGILFGLYHLTDAEPPQLTVALDVNSDPESDQELIRGFFTEELRKIPDIVLVPDEDKHLAARISVAAMSVPSGSTAIHVLTVQIFSNVFRDAKLIGSKAFHDSLDSEVALSEIEGFQTFLWGKTIRTPDLRKSVQDVVAEMDGTPLQHRQRAGAGVFQSGNIRLVVQHRLLLLRAGMQRGGLAK